MSAPSKLPGSVPVWLRLLAIPVVVVLFLLGVWLFGGVVSNDFEIAMALTAAWFVVSGAAAFLVCRRRRELLLPVGATFLVTATVVGGVLAWTTLREETVNERLLGGRAVATGSFFDVAHPTQGSAAILETASGTKLRLTDFETDAGPDLFVYLVAGDDPEDVSDNKSLGSLKGNKGNQQYAVPAGLDTTRYDTVVIWCRAFSVAFGAAELRPA